MQKNENMSELVSRQIARLKGYCVDGWELNLNTRTTYYSQRDNYTMPNRTCNSSANAMLLNWYRLATGRKALGGDDEYLRVVLQYGDTIYHENQTSALKEFGFGTKWIESNSEQKDIDIIRELIATGIPTTVNILHRGKSEAPRGGHIILLCGQLNDSREWLCQDPYGTLRSDYQDHNGRLSCISSREFSRRWQGGYRILDA
jgi:hypothetical protein